MTLATNAKDTVYIGCMTGTSADAVADFTAATFSPDGHPQKLMHHAVTIPTALQTSLRLLSSKGGRIKSAQHSQVTLELSRFLAAAFLQVIEHWGLSKLAKHRIILSPHGQTICHQPQQGITEQLLDAALIANKTGHAVVHQHRVACLKVSNAAPLAPVLLQQLFTNRRHNTIILNGGGIANITVLPQDREAPLVGYDTGPANGPLDSLIDHFVTERPHQLPTHMKNAQYDPNGELAASGKLIQPLYDQLLNDPYFGLPLHQKSADRQDFDLDWIGDHHLYNHSAADLCHTVAVVVATSIEDAIKKHVSEQDSLFYCYGGIAHNRFIMQRIEQGLLHTSCQVESLQQIGLHGDFIESLLMAYLGFCVTNNKRVDLHYCSKTQDARCIPGSLLLPKTNTMQSA